MGKAKNQGTELMGWVMSWDLTCPAYGWERCSGEVHMSKDGDGPTILQRGPDCGSEALVLCLERLGAWEKFLDYMGESDAKGGAVPPRREWAVGQARARDRS